MKRDLGCPFTTPVRSPLNYLDLISLIQRADKGSYELYNSLHPASKVTNYSYIEKKLCTYKCSRKCQIFSNIHVISRFLTKKLVHVPLNKTLWPFIAFSLPFLAKGLLCWKFAHRSIQNSNSPLSTETIPWVLNTAFCGGLVPFSVRINHGLNTLFMYR